MHDVPTLGLLYYVLYSKTRWKRMDYRAAIIVSCWLTVAIISSVYMLVFGNDLTDIVFGVFLPIGMLILVAILVTFMVLSSFESEKRRKIET